MAFEAKLSRIRVALMLAGSIGFVVAGLWLVGAFGAPPSTTLKATLAGWGGIVFFGLCAIVLARRLFQAGVEIRVDADGIYWRRWSDQTIPWNAIARISTGEIRRQRFVCLFLIDPHAFPSHGIAGKLAGANAAMGFGDIALSATGTDASFDQLMAAIDRFAPA
jgi:hypothetical protein